MPKPLHESTTTLAAATTGTSDAGLLEVEFITPGWGSSGYYSREVVEAAAPLFAPGTHMYFDHPSATETNDRPERSVRDLAAVIEEAGTVNPATGGIRGKVRPLKAYEALLTDEAFAKNVGLSIRGSASDITVGEAEGRTGPLIEGLVDLASVDFVTRAGRGGRVLAVLESAGVQVAEATAGDRITQLRDLIRAAFPGRGIWAYVHDIDAEENTVWFEVNREDGPTSTYQQSYVVADNDVDVSLTGDPLEVRRVTNYVPVNPAGQFTTTEESEEDTMPQIEEARLRELEEAHGRVPTLESERDTAVRERDSARRELAAERAVSRGRTLIHENDARRTAAVEFTALEERGLLAGLTLTEDGALDEDAFTAAVEAAVTDAAASRGAGAVTGFGGTATAPAAVTESDIDKAVAQAFGRTVKEA